MNITGRPAKLSINDGMERVNKGRVSSGRVHDRLTFLNLVNIWMICCFTDDTKESNLDACARLSVSLEGSGVYEVSLQGFKSETKFLTPVKV